FPAPPPPARARRCLAATPGSPPRGSAGAAGGRRRRPPRRRGAGRRGGPRRRGPPLPASRRCPRRSRSPSPRPGRAAGATVDRSRGPTPGGPPLETCTDTCVLVLRQVAPRSDLLHHVLGGLAQERLVAQLGAGGLQLLAGGREVLLQAPALRGEVDGPGGVDLHSHSGQAQPDLERGG